MANLTEAWTKASAALPLGWELEGVMSGAVYLMALAAAHDLPTGFADWIALASDGDTNVIGEGEAPHQALLDLASKLEPIRGSTTG